MDVSSGSTVPAFGHNILWNPESWLSCLQEPSTGLYPESDQSSPVHATPSYLRPVLILSTHLRLYLSSGLFPDGISHQNAICSPFIPIRATWPAHLILLDFIILIILGEEY
jgi:hypothetical protein